MSFKPLFLTGANAKIVVNGAVCGFATDIALSERITAVAPKVIGMYESETIETQSYDVLGSFTVVRYMKGVRDFFINVENLTSVPHHLSNSGNSITNFVGDAFLLTELREAGFFDLEIYQKLDPTVIDPFAVKNEVSAFKIHKCKILSSDAVISKRGILTQNMVFQGCYLDDDATTNTSLGSRVDGDKWEPRSDGDDV